MHFGKWIWEMVGNVSTYVLVGIEKHTLQVPKKAKTIIQLTECAFVQGGETSNHI